MYVRRTRRRGGGVDNLVERESVATGVEDSGCGPPDLGTIPASANPLLVVRTSDVIVSADRRVDIGVWRPL